MAKKTYLTKAEALSLARYCHSDERRLKLQIECREKLLAGTINPLAWSVAERLVTDEDYVYWNENLRYK